MKNSKPFDYSNLTGEEFQRYLKHIDELAPTDEPSKEQFDFDEYTVSAAFTGPDGKQKFDGIILHSQEPLRRIRTEVRHARLHNRQIENTKNQVTGGKYLLLKQDTL